jgi:hypothetical protein
VVVLAIFVVACSGDGGISPSETGAMTWPTGLSQGDSDSVTSGSEDATGSSTGDGPVTDATTDPSVTSTGSSGSSGEVASSGGEPPAITCTYPSTSFGGAAKELMVPAGSSERLGFSVPGLPAPAQVVTATLQFVSYDSDHPGAEGTIIVNGGAAIDLPADPAWENAEHTTAVDITGATVAGTNAIEFGAGSFPDGTFYRIAQVALELTAHVDACPEAPAQPPKAVQLDYDAAIYTRRHNWVLRCDFLEGYAFTAKGDQAQLDCGMLYDPDGTRTGTATFVFENLAPATYEITIKSRHSANRNPKGALFVVDGEGKRIDQTVGEDIVVDTWGTKALAGTVEVVLDSDMEGESDSVTWIRLEPL